MDENENRTELNETTVTGSISPQDQETDPISEKNGSSNTARAQIKRKLERVELRKRERECRAKKRESA